MDLHEIQAQATVLLREASHAFQKVPGSAVLIRYVQASYQNDPIRSIFELFLLIFFIRYLLSPSYSTNDSNYVKLSEAEIEELIDEWQPEPLVGEQTPFEELETENLPVIVGYVSASSLLPYWANSETNHPPTDTGQPDPSQNSPTAEPSRTSRPTTSTTSTGTNNSRKRPLPPCAPTVSAPVALRSSTATRMCT